MSTPVAQPPHTLDPGAPDTGSLRRLSSILASAPAVLYTLDARPPHQSTYVSDNVRSALGYEPGAVHRSAKSWLDLVHPDDRSRVARDRLQFRDGRSTLEYRLRTAAGAYRWFSDDARLVRAPWSTPEIVGCWVDLSERGGLDTTHRSSQEWFQAIVENSSDVVMLLDERGAVLYDSPSVRRVLGYEPEALIGRDVFTLVHPDDLEAAHCLFADASQHPGRTYTIEIKIVAADGRLVMLDVSGKFVRSPHGPLRALVNARDMTSRHHADAISRWLATLERTALTGAGLARLADEACNGLVTLSGADAAWFDVAGPEGSLKVAVAVARSSPGSAPYIDGLGSDWRAGMAGYAPATTIQTKRVMLWRHDDAPGSPWLDYMRGHGLRATVATPLHAGDRPIGVITLAFADEHDAEAAGGWLRQIAARLTMSLVAAMDHARLRLQGTAMASAANAIFITDRSGRIEWVNAAFSRMTGYDPEEILGQNPRILKSGHQDEESYARLWETILGGQVWRGEITNRMKDGRLYNVDQTITPLRDPHGAVTHFVAIHDDITKRKEAEARILHLAQHDALTGLPNRTLLRDRLNQALLLARRAHHGAALLFIDVDHLKHVNDSAGHRAGDTLLGELAHRLTATVRATDTVARISGDEFLVLLPDVTTPQQAARVARKLLSVLNRPLDAGGRRLQTTVSIGIALFPADGSEPEQLMRSADTAMYRVKKRGGNGYQLFTRTMQAEVRRRLLMDGALRSALKANQFMLYYQPIFELATRRMTGVEALLRWKDPLGQLRLPAEFIPIAEDTGLIGRLGDWVLATACRDAKRWHDAGHPLTLGVNLSVRQIEQPGADEHLAAIVRTSGLPPSALRLEVTEGVFVSDGGAAVRALLKLRTLGAGVVIDDFGTGYASLSYLKRLPVDSLKIDKEFIGGLPTNADNTAIVSAILAMASALQIQVVAEGVETEEQAAFLRRAGCRFAQGFLLAEPSPVIEIERRLEEA